MLHQYQKKLVLTFLVALLASTAAVKAAPPAGPTPYDSVGLPLNRYSPLEILSLKSLTAEQKQKLMDFYTNSKTEQSIVMKDLASIWLNEVLYYPELADLPTGKNKEPLPAELDSHDRQIENIRLKIYTLISNPEASDKKEIEAARKPKQTLAQYGADEKIQVEKLNTLLNGNSKKAVAMLTDEQQAELKNNRDLFEKENAARDADFKKSSEAK